MEPRRNLDLLLGVMLLLAVVFLRFELYVWLIIPGLLITAGILSSKFSAVAAHALRTVGSFFSMVVTKVFVSTLFFLILLPVVIAQGLITKS
jgi:hypothetical protein